MTSGSHSKIAGVLLAAGAGRRFGRPKAMVSYRGRLLVEHGLDTLRQAGCEPTLVVLGAASDAIRERANLTEATVVVNEAWPTGLGSSLRSALSALATTDAEATVVLLVDTPGITAEAVRRVCIRAGPTTLVSATYHGRRRHPIVLGRTHWAGIADQAQGDTGARPYLNAHAAALLTVECADIADPSDIDHPSELAGSDTTPSDDQP